LFKNGIVGKERAVPSQSGGIPVGDAHRWSVLSSELLENALRLPKTSSKTPRTRFPIVDGHPAAAFFVDNNEA
jgi:hypothetical protein